MPCKSHCDAGGIIANNTPSAAAGCLVEPACLLYSPKIICEWGRRIETVSKVSQGFLGVLLLALCTLQSGAAAAAECRGGFQAHYFAQLTTDEWVVIKGAVNLDDAKKVLRKCVKEDVIDDSKVMYDPRKPLICEPTLICRKQPDIIIEKTEKELPPGSYRNSCPDCKVEGTNLRCSCKTGEKAPDYFFSGFVKTQWSTINYRSCVTIVNDTGKLRCQREIAKLPKGGYTQSCNRCTINRGVLRCRCKSGRLDSGRNPEYENSRLKVARCGHQDIVNLYGQLKCAGDVPQGSFRKSCKDISVSGGVLSAKCKNGVLTLFGQPIYKSTKITLSKCTKFKNIRGVLKCEGKKK
jgi:hypothetical protein